jgi:hypothetical protein
MPSGNRVTALRWARILREEGHVVRMRRDADPSDGDVLLALHAVRSADAIATWRREKPGAPVVLGMTGTDLYDEGPDDPRCRASLEAADRIVVLQPRAVDALPESVRPRVRVVHQSVQPP